MYKSSFSEEAGKEMVGKAIMWLPAIIGAIALGPVGAWMGLATSVAIAHNHRDEPPPTSGRDSPKV